MNTIFAYNNLETPYPKTILAVNHNLNSVKYTTSQKRQREIACNLSHCYLEKLSTIQVLIKYSTSQRSSLQLEVLQHRFSKSYARKADISVEYLLKQEYCFMCLTYLKCSKHSMNFIYT